MTTISTEDPLATAAVAAIHSGDLQALNQLLREHVWLAAARLGDDDPNGMSRTLLHVATDWPGRFPHVAASIAALVEAGADLNARFRGPHEETPLHWAASSDDVEALDALLDAGADIEAPGAVLGGGPPLADARGFKQWRAACRLVERGARTTLDDAATLGMFERLEEYFVGAAADPARDEITRAFWGACHGGRQRCAQYLLDRGAELNWIPPWENLTPLDAASREDADQLVRWLRSRGAKSAEELPQ
jgi:ankyrin repeat protein